MRNHMKGNREQIYEFVKLHSSVNANHGISTNEIAEALGKQLASDVSESYSAGTETVPRINPDAVRIMKQLYGIDMELTQRSKLLSELPPVDIVVTMGCNVNCHLPCKHREDWGLDDPTGCEDEVFKETIQTIHQKVISLKYRIENGLFSD